MRFKDYLLNEQKEYLASKIGDILASLQELKDSNAKKRDLSEIIDSIVSKIRSLINSDFGDENRSSIVALRDVAFYLKNSIENNADMDEVMSNSISALENVTSKLGQPINKLAVTDSSPKSDFGQTSKPIIPNKPPDQSKPPKNPKDLENTNEPTSPAQTGMDQFAQSLGGSSGNLMAF
jgi:hypothetical protein